jgi:hypothetical protein
MDAVEVCGAVVLMVIVAVTGSVPVIETDAGIVQVGAFVAFVEKPFGVQVRLTGPVKEPAGVKVSVDVLPVVAPGGEIVTGVPDAEKGITMETEKLTV